MCSSSVVLDFTASLLSSASIFGHRSCGYQEMTISAGTHVRHIYDLWPLETPLFEPTADFEPYVIHMYCYVFSMCVSVRQRREQLTCYSLLIKSDAYITECSRVWIWLHLGAPQIDQQHLWIYEYVKSVARSRGSKSFSLGVASVGNCQNKQSK